MEPRPSVLIVDDDPDELELIAASLEPLDVDTAKASDSAEALRLTAERRFSAALLDLVMPRLNGFETAALLLASENGRGLPVLILSGYDEQASRRLPGWAAVAGRVGFLGKPFSPEALRRRVQDVYSEAWTRSSGLAPSR
jgi:two-component system sensor histidine kinase/response regulator